MRKNENCKTRKSMQNFNKNVQGKGSKATHLLGLFFRILFSFVIPVHKSEFDKENIAKNEPIRCRKNKTKFASIDLLQR